MTYLSPNQKKGLWAEKWVADELRIRGYEVRVPPDFSQPCCDLIIGDNTPVEVKFSSQLVRTRTNKNGTVRTYPKWSWDTGKISRDEGLLFLIAVDGLSLRWPFIMPMSLMHGRAGFEINSHPRHYTGMMAPFLKNWDVVPFVTGQEYKDPNQLDLFNMSLTGEISYSRTVTHA